MDIQTRQALKKDKFAQATASSVSWLSGHRSGVLRWVIVAVVVLVAGVGALVFWNLRSTAAETALGAALDVYNAGRLATRIALRLYSPFAQLFGRRSGEPAAAETELKAAAGAWDRNLANLAKLALAGLYHQTNRDAQAISLYNELAAKPSDTVSTAVAQLDLADLYAASGKQDQARALWAKVSDADKDGAAGSIAAQKLAAKQ